jgi:serine protease Do
MDASETSQLEQPVAAPARPAQPARPAAPRHQTALTGLLLAGALGLGVLVGGGGREWAATAQRDLSGFGARIGNATAALTAPAAPTVGAVAAPASPASAASNPASQPVAAQSSLADLQSDLVAVAQKVGPAVVLIRTETARGSGLGSGVIYDSSGLILTNAHVVANARTVNVALPDGRRFDGKVLGRDTGFDLAVIKIDGDGLPSAPLGDSKGLQVGQVVVAIGNPLGLDNTFTNGVVSAINRAVSEGPGSYAQPMIQTNAAINPGNSGGPLVDLDGRVIGINTLVASLQGVPAQGLGFAVPIVTAARIAPQLASQGRVVNSGQPYLGVGLGSERVLPRNAPAPRGPRSTSQPGVPIASLEPSGPAAKAGLQTGDVVTQIDGRDVYSPDDLLQALVVHKPGDSVQLMVQRQGGQQTVAVTLGEAPPRQA